MSVLAYGVVAWLFLVGVYGVVTSRNLIHMVVCLSVAQSATDVLLLEMGTAAGAHARCSSACAPSGTGRRRGTVRELALTDVVVAPR